MAWQANHSEDWHSLTACPGWLRLFPQFVGDGNLTKAPNLLLQKFPARSFVAETILEFVSEKSGVEAGLVIAGKTCAALVLRRAGNKNQIIFRHGEKAEVLREISGGQITLRVTVPDGGLCEFSFAELSHFTSVPQKFQAVAGTWIGAKLGIYTLKHDSENPAGHADFKCFRFRPTTATN